MPETVALLKQPDYDEATLPAAIARAVSLCGFNLQSVRGKRVLLKPNCLGPFPPSMGVTSDPRFVTAVAKMFSSVGAEVFMGDSPGTVHLPKRSFEACGLMSVSNNSCAKYISFEASGNRNVGGIMLANAVFEFDFLVNLPRFKTHSLTALSLAVKNLFGCVNGMQKAKFHNENRDRKSFCELIVRIAEAANPQLNIIDGIVAMEGNGPSGGKLKELGIIAASTNMHALDYVCARIAGITPEKLDTINAAIRMKLFNPQEPIEVVGQTVDSVRPKQFQMPDTFDKNTLDWRISKFILGLIWGHLSCQPVINNTKCTKCLVCKRSCPADAIAVRNDGFPFIEKKKCIQCYCCHEACEFQAIRIKKNALASIGSLITTVFTKIKRKD